MTGGRGDRVLLLLLLCKESNERMITAIDTMIVKPSLLAAMYSAIKSTILPTAEAMDRRGSRAGKRMNFPCSHHACSSRSKMKTATASGIYKEKAAMRYRWACASCSGVDRVSGVFIRYVVKTL